jgi:hypothetical protein
MRIRKGARGCTSQRRQRLTALFYLRPLKILLGAADMYTLVGETPLADLTSRDPNPSVEEVLDALIARLRD